MSSLNIRGTFRGLHGTVNADAVSPCFGKHFEVREARARVAVANHVDLSFAMTMA